MANQYQYFQPSSYSAWRAQVNITYPNMDACVVDIPTYIDGRKTFPCASGDDHKLTSAEQAKINKLISQAINMAESTPARLYNQRIRLEQKIAEGKSQFYEWKDCLDWAIAEVNMSYKALSVMYTDPTGAEPFLGKHLNDKWIPGVLV